MLQVGRTCYSHLAGRLGVSICDGLTARGALQIEDDLAHLTPQGLVLLGHLGLDAALLQRSAVSKTCIDWSERRHHLSGPLGVAIYRRCVELGWLRHHLDSRAVSLTARGARQWGAFFGRIEGGGVTT